MNKTEKLCFFVFKDEVGTVESYVRFFLEKIAVCFEKLYIVCDEKLPQKEKNILSQYGSIAFESDLVFDESEIFREIFRRIDDFIMGGTKEVFVVHSNLMGPIGAFEQAINCMEQRDLDFWGMFPNFFEKSQTGVAFEFLVMKTTLIKTYEFKHFLVSHADLAKFTSYFSSKGFTWDTYVHLDDLKGMTDQPLLFYARDIVENRMSPVFLKDVFDMDYLDLIDTSLGEEPRELLEYLQKADLYDVNYIWDYLLKRRNQADIVKLLHLNYTLPTTISDIIYVQEVLKIRKVALLAHIYRTDMVEIIMRYASYMPELADIYITTDTEDKRAAIQHAFDQGLSNKVEVRIVENRGRDVSSKLVGVKDVIMEYDYVCCIHDKKTPHLKPMSVGEGFSHKCFDNVLFNKAYANNVITLFEKNPRMGIAVPPEPNHANFFTTLGYEWSGNFDIAEKLAKKLGLNIPMSEDKEPVAPFGSFFWFRPKALKLLYDRNWEFSDFPKEPIADNNTVLHAIERIYPFVAQQEGYYPVIIMSDKMASIEYTNIKYYLREYNKILIKQGMIYKHQIMCKNLERSLVQNKPPYECCREENTKQAGVIKGFLKRLIAQSSGYKG